MLPTLLRSARSYGNVLANSTRPAALAASAWGSECSRSGDSSGAPALLQRASCGDTTSSSTHIFSSPSPASSNPLAAWGSSSSSSGSLVARNGGGCVSCSPQAAGLAFGARRFSASTGARGDQASSGGSASSSSGGGGSGGATFVGPKSRRLEPGAEEIRAAFAHCAQLVRGQRGRLHVCLAAATRVI